MIQAKGAEESLERVSVWRVGEGQLERVVRLWAE